MAKTFKLEIVTPEETAFSAEVTSLQVPAWEGYLGVLASHAPLLTVLKAGVLSVKDAADKASFFAIKGGFMEVRDNRAVVLADAIEPATGIEVEAARKALDAASAAPLPAPAAGGDAEQRTRLRELAVEEHRAARDWAEARLRAAERHKEGA